FIKTALNYRGNKSGNLTFVLNGTQYDVNENHIMAGQENFLYSNGDANPEDYICIGCNSTSAAKYNISYNLSGFNSNGKTYIGTALNYKGQKKTLRFELNGTWYDVDTSLLDKTNIFEYFDGNLSPDSSACVGCFVSSNQYVLRYTMPNISNMDVKATYVKTLIQHHKNNTKNITMNVNGSIYTIEGAKIKASDTENYTIDDGSIENADCVGCNVGFEQKSIVYFNLGAHDAQNINSESTYLRARMCYNGSRKNITLSGSGINNEIYVVNTSAVPLCNGTSSWSWTETEINTIHLKNNLVRIDCTNCNDTENYYIMADNSTTGNSHIYDGTLYQPAYDFIIQLFTNTSLNYTTVLTKVNVSGIGAHAVNITYNCSTCAGGEYYKIMADVASDGVSYNSSNGTNWSLINYGLMVSIWSNESLGYDVIQTQVTSSDIANNINISYSCTGCTNTDNYNILVDTDTSGASYNSSDG
ncbi:MAG: hypothetical protein KAJ24_05345, partial [Candidatus Aenigmarchaeota archaeon]|nr:hypothetical protein [Candidatus Aenigmarchaeota archaeon]